MNWQKLSTIGNIVQGAIRFSQPFYFRVDNLIQNTILGCEIWDDDDISWEIAKLRESAEDLPTVDAYTRTEDLWLTKLTERDWKVILTGSVVENYKKNGIILEQGDPNSYLYLIKSGTVRVEKDTDDGTKIFTTLEKGDTFGEVSLVVKEGRTSMRCVADSEVEVNKIQISLVIEICQQSPKISQSLHYLIAFKLAQKLKSFNNSTEKLTEVKRNKEPKNQEKKEKELTGVNSDDKFYKLFKIENEVVVQEYSCQLKGKVKSPGTVYITPKYICFSSNNFGYKIREVLSFNLINKIKKQNNKIIIDIKDLPKPIILTGFESINDTCKVMKDIWKKICSVDSNTNDSHVDSMPSPLIDKTIDIPPTTDEITKILNGSKITKYKKGDVLINEGDIPRKLFYIISGSCKVVKENRIISIIELDSIFGEVSFLEGCPATATVIACEELEVNIIEAYYLHVLFQYQPQVAGRFYHYLASVLSKRITERERNN